MRVVVTGGAGFIGGNLVRVLTEHPAVESVVVVDDLSTGSLENLRGVPDVDLRIGTILDPRVLDGAMAGADAVVHLAALPSVPRSIDNPHATHAVNATGTLEVLQAARRAGNLHTIVASSSSIYGASPVLPKHEDLPPAPLSPYAVAKLATETYTLAWGHCYGLPVLAFRFFNVFGPLQPAGHAYAAVMPAFISAALAGQSLQIYGDGLQSRDFTFVGSVVAVLADAVERRVTSLRPVNLAFGSQRTLLDVIQVLEETLGRPLVREHLPTRAGDVRHSQADQSRLRELFPDVEPVDFMVGVKTTVEWFRTWNEQQAAAFTPAGAAGPAR